MLEKNVINYNQIAGEKYGSVSNSKKISRNDAQSESFIRSGDNNAEYVKNRRTATRNDGLYNKERRHNNRPSNSAAFSKNTLRG